MTLRAEAVQKRFEDRPVLNGVTLSLEPGEVVWLSGSNGSGKTTLARILATLLPPDDGEVTLDEIPVSERRSAARRAIGFATHQPMLYPGLTAFENLDFFARLARVRDGASRALHLLERFGMVGAARRPVAHYSRGMLQRVVLCRALLNDPAFLILDEPYAGLDEEGVAAVNGVLAEGKAGGRGALVIAHDKDRAARTATRALRLRGGLVEAA